MSDTQETLADIVAEMRERTDLDGRDMVDNFDLNIGDRGGYDALMLIKAYADRIEAAAKRERLWREGEAEVDFRSPTPDGEVGNMAKMREAWRQSKVDYYNSVGRTFKIETPEPPTCDTCKHFCGMHQQEIDFDTGDTMLVVSCDIQMHATPDLAKSCVFYQRRAAQ